MDVFVGLEGVIGTFVGGLLLVCDTYGTFPVLMPPSEIAGGFPPRLLVTVVGAA